VQRQREGLLPKVPIWDDVRTFDGKPWRGKVDVVCAGFPCQDISCAGLGAGIDGEQSGLWVEAIRVIGEVRPRYTIIENSPMLLLRGGTRVVAALAGMGLACKWGIVSSRNAGFNNTRKRLWIIADAIGDEQSRQKPRSRQTGRVGRVVKSIQGNAKWESALRRFRGMDDGMAYGVERTDSIRNGQVPAVVKLAWETLS
jgi:DNA (cytosine-5)-methyltransferase 1